MSQYYHLTSEDRIFALDLYQKILRRDTQNPPGNEVYLVRDLIDLLEPMGLKPRVGQQIGDRANFILDVEPEDHATRKLPPRCFNGHLDTVPQGDPAQWNGSALEPRVEERDTGNYIIARGSTDMKGGLSAMIAALCMIQKHNLTLARPLRLLGTFDEESSGAGAHAYSKTGGLDDLGEMIICEPSGLDLSVCAKGAMWLQFVLVGKTAHAAYPEQGKNTLTTAYAIYLALKDLVAVDDHPLLGSSTCTLVQLKGGVKTNMVPDKATMVLDVRLVPERNQNEVLEQLKETAEMFAATGGCQIHLNVINQRIAVTLSEKHPLCKEVSMTYTSLWPGESPSVTGARFFSDASIFKLYRDDLPILILGPGDPEMCHKPEEEAPLAQFYRAIELYIALMTS